MIYQKIYLPGNITSARLIIPVATNPATDPVNIRLIVRDSSQKNTILTNRVWPVQGQFMFDVYLPLMRKSIEVTLINEDAPQLNNFTYAGNYSILPLPKRYDRIDFSKTWHLNEFMDFSQKFSFNAGILPTNEPYDDQDYYRSSNSHFFIKYLPVITDYETGEELTTPARICETAPVIEISQKYFKEYTVPEREAILLHEYCHPFANSNPDSEKQADANSLFIYLGYGYPRVEAYKVWTEVFTDCPTEQNQQRQQIIEKLIADFDDPNVKF